jgi:hypothetical protein
MARKKKTVETPDQVETPNQVETPIAETEASAEVETAGEQPEQPEPPAKRQRMTGEDLKVQLRQQRREARLKEKGY